MVDLWTNRSRRGPSRYLIFFYMSDSLATVEKIALVRFFRDAFNWKCIFQCDCCKLENDDDIPRTLPDLSIIYKLHLESRKLINMYDWLQVTIPARAHVYRLIPVTLTVTNPDRPSRDFNRRCRRE